MQSKMVDIREKNTFGVPAWARDYVEVDSLDAMRALRERLAVTGEEYYILGRGANVLFVEPYPGVVVHPVGRALVVAEHSAGVLVRAGAGWDWDEFVGEMAARGLWGLECLSGIPGTVGAAPVQNIGAYGAEVGDCLFVVRSFDMQSGQLRERPVGELELGYRDSLFKHTLRGAEIIYEVEFLLQRECPASNRFARLGLAEAEAVDCTPSAIRARVLDIRRGKLPVVGEVGSAGSFFKNPEVDAECSVRLAAEFPGMPVYPGTRGRVKLSAGWLIDYCGWKGFREGDAGVWPQQALVLVNYGRATGEEIVGLCERIRQDVLDRTGVLLEPEVNIVGGVD